MRAQWTGLTVDCVDPERMAAFWGALLERERTAEMSGPDWACLGSRGDTLPRITFQRVPEPRAGKVRLHLDVTVDDLDAAVLRVEALGGRAEGTRQDYDEGSVMTMLDPEGHVFCLVRYADDGPR